jgi:uncharacterized YccA/Bax inhibitor family protein
MFTENIAITLKSKSINMLEIIFVFIGELLFQLIGTIIGELIFHVFIQPFRRDANPKVAVIGYGLMGLGIGAISLLFSPTHLIKPEVWRLVNFLVTPLFAGLITTLWKIDKLEKKPPIYQNHRFYYGFLFALGWLLIRLIYAK